MLEELTFLCFLFTEAQEEQQEESFTQIHWNTQKYKQQL